MNNPSTKTRPDRVVPAPMASDPRLRSTILDVSCGYDEEVDWHWTVTAEGCFVSGYSVVPRSSGPPRVEAEVNESAAQARSMGFTADLNEKA